MRHLFALALLFGLTLAAPAQAQTDDRLLNDILKVLGIDGAVTRLGENCAAETGNDPAVAGAFKGWGERNSPWRIVAVTLIGTRGGMPEGALAAAREQANREMDHSLATSGDKAAWCRTLAADFDSQQTSVATLYPVPTRRMSEASSGGQPKLDVDASPAVADALAVKTIFIQRERLMLICADAFGDDDETAPYSYAEAYPEWHARNYPIIMMAERILENWGAMAPERLAEPAIRADAELADLEADDEALFGACIDFVDNLDSGGSDIDVVAPALYQSMRTNADIIP